MLTKDRAALLKKVGALHVIDLVKQSIIDVLLREINALEGERASLIEKVERLTKKTYSLGGKMGGLRSRTLQTPYALTRSDERKRKRESIVKALTPLVSNDGVVCIDSVRLIVQDLHRELTGENMFPSLTVKEDVQLFRLLDLSWGNRRELAKFLRFYHINILPGWNRTFKYYKDHITLAHDKYESVTVCGGDISVVRIRDVKERLQLVVNEQGDHCNLEGHWRGKVMIGIAIDGGGGIVKLMVNVLNSGHGNSPRHMILIGAYIGNESHDAVKESFGVTFRELFDIDTLLVKGHLTEVEFSLCADRKMTNILYGIMSCSCRHPCAQCDWRKGNSSHAQCTMRSMEDIERGAEEYRESVSAEGESISERVLCTVNQPLVKIPPDNIWPPTVHISIGQGGRLMIQLELECINHDLSQIGEVEVRVSTLDDVENAIVRFGNEMENSRKWVRDSERELQDLQLLKNLRECAVFSKRTSAFCESRKCVLGMSAVPQWKNWSDKIECSNCGNSFHLFCTTQCLHNADKSAISIPDSFNCERCQVVNDASVRKRLLNRERKMVGELNVSKARFSHLANHKDLITDAIRGKGASHLALIRFWKGKKIFRSPTFQPYNGRMVKRALSFIKEAINEIGFAPDPYIVDASTSLGCILSYAKPRFLTNNEIDTLEGAVHDFSTSYPQVIRTANEQVLFHTTIAHIVPFAKAKRTIGLFSEQGLESCHKWLKTLLIQFTNVSDPRERLHRVVCEHEFTSSLLSD